jgi:hypothetical protein
MNLKYRLVAPARLNPGQQLPWALIPDSMLVAP